jgi:hypothetical protein
MTADLSAPPTVTYGVKYWSREVNAHVTVDCGTWVEAWTLLRERQQHVDLSALLMHRVAGDEAWCAVSPDESDILLETYLAAQRAVTHG